jgi:hypothetical protein
VINPDTWVCVTWQPFELTNIPKPREVGTGNFQFVWLNPNSSNLDCLIPLKDLLDIVDYGIRNEAPVRVLDGYNGGKIARHALRAALCRSRSMRNIKYTGIWRSMLMRTSEHPIDVVYSAMGLFGLQIDPYRKHRDATYLFYDLARKAAASTITRPIGSPCWLTLGRIVGRSFEYHIPRDPASQLIPRFPNIQANQPPTYNDGRSVLKMIESSGNYIKTFDIQFITHSHPHIINALMSPLCYNDVLVRQGMLTFRGKTARCHYQDFGGRLEKRKGSGVWAVYVGQVKSMRSGKIAWPRNRTDVRTRLYTDARYLLFMEYRQKKWQLVGNGIFMPSDRDWNPPLRRYNITVGQDSQQRRKLWAADMLPSRVRVRPFRYHSYGIIPLPDFPTASPQPRRIEWYGYKNHNIPRQPIRWKRLQFNYDMTTFLSLPDSVRDQRLVFPKPFYIVTATSSRPPNVIQQYPRHQVKQLGNMFISFSWGGWTVKQCQMLALDGVEGVMLPAGKTRATYWVRLRFGKCMIYVELKSSRTMRPEYHQMYVVPYGGRPIGLITPELLQSLPLPPDNPPRQFYQPGTPVPRNMQTQYIFPQSALPMYPNLPLFPAYTRGAGGNLVALRQFYQPGTPVPPNMQTQYIFQQSGLPMYPNLP